MKFVHDLTNFLKPYFRDILPAALATLTIISNPHFCCQRIKSPVFDPLKKFLRLSVDSQNNRNSRANIPLETFVRLTHSYSRKSFL